MDINLKLASEFSLKPWQIENTVKLIDDGNTIPFIARYRKEATGSLDDQLLRSLYDRLAYLRNMEEQKEKILSSIEEQGLLTDEIKASVENASTLTELDDIYRPYRPKRKTRASVAKAKGLQGLADAIYAQEKSSKSPLELAEDYLSDEVETVEDAVNGAKDIIAEMVSDDPAGRKMLRYSVKNNGIVVVIGASEDLGVYEMYKEYSEPVKSIAPHRVLAVNRGEKEGVLKVSIDFDKITGLNILKNLHIKDNAPTTDAVIEAIEDAYTRLIFPSIEREIRNSLTENADESAIGVFAKNTRQLLIGKKCFIH